MYLGDLVTAIGELLVFRAWTMVEFLQMSLVVIARAIRVVELLEQEFGNEWKSYASKVTKWFPRL